MTSAEIDREIEEFLAWAGRYDDGGTDVRSLFLHEQWMATLTCPILRMEGDVTKKRAVNAVLDAIGRSVDRSER